MPLTVSQSPEADPRERSWLRVMERLREVLRDEYDVLGLLGFGGFAGVFLARERRLRRRVALKVMSPEVMLGHNMIERFQQEAVTQANLNHPNIASVYGVREVADMHFFAMQYIPGRTLQSALRAELDAGRLLSVGVVRALLHHVGSALEYAHGEGVIHRDVKPGNVLLSADGRAIVTDFGIAKVAEGPSLTMVSAVQGTAGYMSPEQCYASELTGATDQYSLGILAFELVAGRLPFVGDPFSVMQAHVSQAPPRLQSLRPDCPADLDAAVARMLAKIPGDRFPTIAAALDTLGATGLTPRRDDPIHIELIRLADCEGMLSRMGEEVRRAMLTPRSSEQVALPDVSCDTSTPPTRPPREPALRPGSANVPTQDAPPPPQTPAVVRSIEFLPHARVLALGEHVALQVICRDSAGEVVPGHVSWELDPPEIGTVQLTGALICRQWGRGRVRAVHGELRAETEIIVGTVPLRRIDLIGVPSRMVTGSSASFAVRVIDMTGAERAIPIALSSSDSAVLVAEAPGSVHAVTPGRVEVIASCGSYQQRATIEISGLR